MKANCFQQKTKNTNVFSIKQIILTKQLLINMSASGNNIVGGSSIYKKLSRIWMIWFVIKQANMYGRHDRQNIWLWVVGLKKTGSFMVWLGVFRCEVDGHVVTDL